MAFGLFYTENNNYGGKVELFLDKEFYTKKMAEDAFKYQLNILAKHKLANEYQPTKIAKDVFHFYIKLEDGTEEKRGFFISRVFKTKNYSLRTKIEAKEIALKNNLIKNY